LIGQLQWSPSVLSQTSSFVEMAKENIVWAKYHFWNPPKLAKSKHNDIFAQVLLA
jgi:hypothetical protein